MRFELPRVEWRRAASGGHRQVEVSNNGQAERVNGSRSQRRGAGSRRSPRPLRRGRLVSGTSSPPSHLCSPSSPFYHPLPLFYFPSSPFIIAGGEEDGETINSYFSLLTICPHCAAPLKKIAFFFSEKQGEYSIWMIYVAVQGLHKSFLDVYPKVEEI